MSGRKWASLFAALLLTLSFAAQSRAAPAKDLGSNEPILLYIAKGAPDSCGPGCSEWIAAEGDFGIGSAAQFRALLARLGKQKLPVFFHSPGGLIDEALNIGRLLREKGIVTGIGRTIPEGCADEKKAKECSAHKKSGKKLDADLLTSRGRCASACSYALLGGKTRMVAPGAALGVHAARSVNIENKRVKAVDLSKRTEQQQKASRQRFREKLRAYLREMGIDARLAEVAEGVPHEKMHYLTRNQIAEFGIDRSTFAETPWKFAEGPNVPAISKFFFEARGDGKSEFPASYVRLACSTSQNGKAAVWYSRGLASGENNRQQIKLLVGDDGLMVASTGVRQLEWIENERSFDQRFAVAEFSSLQVPGDVLEIIETSWDPPAPYTHIVRLSSKGWGEALGKLREKCLNPGGFSAQDTRG